MGGGGPGWSSSHTRRKAAAFLFLMFCRATVRPDVVASSRQFLRFKLPCSFRFISKPLFRYRFAAFRAAGLGLVFRHIGPLIRGAGRIWIRRNSRSLPIKVAYNKSDRSDR